MKSAPSHWDVLSERSLYNRRSNWDLGMRIAALVFAVLMLSACTGLQRNPIEATDLVDPQVPGIEGARLWADVTPPNLEEIVDEAAQQRRAAGLTGPQTTLSLSGGSEGGAFSAGILTAWSEVGTRPEFTSVLGVSTGALIAPFAFLGSDYDDELKRLYGGLPPSQIFESRSIFGILPNASIKSTGPLKALIDEYLTDEFLAEIAAEHRRGRRLAVQTVSLDAQRPVFWDLGTIANSGAPNAAEVFRDVLLASASIPGFFPPVLIDVDSPGGVRDELHVDGSVFSQSLLVPGWRIPKSATRNSTLYAILNSKVTPELDATDLGIRAVTFRSLSTLLKAQAATDLAIAFESSRKDSARFQATWISPDFTVPLNEPFDPDYMAALFDYGYTRFKTGNLWSDKPPE
ncbi:MAG: patatin-like phospholipase family protein [Dinoroseobacter sp.]|nr:patatin-like phospholipase family protein [Dinoroseobacter sp.]